MDGEEKKTDERRGRAPRARNRTVMLTADVASQVRARLAQEAADSDVEQELPVEQEPELATQEFVVTQSDTDSDTSVVALEEELPVIDSIPSGNNAEVDAVVQVASVDLQELVEPLQNVEDVAEVQEVAEIAEAVEEQEAVVQQVEPSVEVVQSPVQEAPAVAEVSNNSASLLVGFLVSYDKLDSGEFYDLRVGRLIVSSDAVSGGPALILEDEGVSAMHAILRISPHGEVQVLDQLSEAGTYIERLGQSEPEHLSGDKSTLSHGDIVRFGSRSFYVCLIPRR